MEKDPFDSEISNNEFDSSETSQCSIGSEWDDDKFIWDRKDLTKVNKLRENKNNIPVVYRN